MIKYSVNDRARCVETVSTEKERLDEKTFRFDGSSRKFTYTGT